MNEKMVPMIVAVIAGAILLAGLFAFLVGGE